MLTHHLYNTPFFSLPVLLYQGTGVLDFPYAASWMGFAGAPVFIAGTASAAYYTALLLSDLQEPGHKTYMDIGKALGGRGWHMMSFQLFFFVPISAVMILIGGQALETIDLMSQGATVTYLGGDCGGYTVDTTAAKLSKRVWTKLWASWFYC